MRASFPPYSLPHGAILLLCLCLLRALLPHQQPRPGEQRGEGKDDEYIISPESTLTMHICHYHTSLPRVPKLSQICSPQNLAAGSCLPDKLISPKRHYCHGHQPQGGCTHAPASGRADYSLMRQKGAFVANLRSSSNVCVRLKAVSACTPTISPPHCQPSACPTANCQLT